MMQFRMTVLWLIAILCPALAGQLLAEDLPTLSIRYMTIQADEIVVAEPIDSQAGTPQNYKVTRVLKEGDIEVGQKIVVRDANQYPSGLPEFWQKPGEKQAAPKIVKALLFLKRPIKPDGEKGYHTVLSGIRALGENKDVLVPQQLMNPGPQYLLPRKGEDFDAMVTQVQRDLPVIEIIRDLETISDQRKRNEAIFKWMEEHKQEFGGGYFAGRPPKGWASLEPQLFDWVMESCIPEDCWKALEFSVELGTGPEKQPPAFCSPRGRELLLEKVSDESLSETLRLLALRELGSGRTYWYSFRDQYPSTRVVTPVEQNKIIDQVLPLLKHKDASWRAAAARCLMSVSWPYDANFQKRVSKRGLSDFVALYRNEKDADVRNAVVEAIRRIGGESFWEKLTGNPKGIVVILLYPRLKEDVLEFRLNLDHSYVTITQPPVFQFQELNEDGSSKKPLLLKATASYPKDLFTKGWEASQGGVVMTVPAAQVKPGRWRVTLNGKWEGHDWHSEPVEVTIPDKTKDE